jgi:alkylation response protein AidB-like acyl-CoA dehydrogenase
MDFDLSGELRTLRDRARAFVREEVVPLEPSEVDEEGLPADLLGGVRRRAREAGVFAPQLPAEYGGLGLDTVGLCVLFEEAGYSPLGPLALHCAAPDEGNMHLLLRAATPEQRRRYLEPLARGEVRSSFALTEPPPGAGSDPTMIQTRATRQDDRWVIDGHKWFTSGAVGAKIAIVMAVTNPGAPPHQRASMILVPTDTKGFNLVRPVSVMGHAGGPGHCEIRYEDCRVPAGNLLGPEHGGFVIAQARLGPGRIHHCMRAIGMAERAFEIMCRHANTRVAFGGPLGEKQFVQEWVASSRMEIDQARLLTLYAAWKMDTYGKQRARQEISMIKVVVPNMLMRVLDRAIQCLGALGMSDDTPVAAMWRDGRSLRIADGPDEVHKMVVARRELKRFA